MSGTVSEHTELPDALPGHYSTRDGRDMLARYMVATRDDLMGGSLTDTEIAFRCGMATGDDIESTGVLLMAKERVRWLSAQLAKAQAVSDSHADLIAALEQIASVCVIPGPGQRPIPTPEAMIARAALDKARAS